MRHALCLALLCCVVSVQSAQATVKLSLLDQPLRNDFQPISSSKIELSAQTIQVQGAGGEVTYASLEKSNLPYVILGTTVFMIATMALISVLSASKNSGTSVIQVLSTSPTTY